MTLKRMMTRVLRGQCGRKEEQCTYQNFWQELLLRLWQNLRQLYCMGFFTAKRNKKGDRNNEKVSKERSEGEHEEERDGEVLQAQQKQSQFLLKSPARVCEVGMKQPKRLTRNQKEILSANRLKADNWSLVEETEFYLKIINKESGKTRMVDKLRRKR